MTPKVLRAPLSLEAVLRNHLPANASVVQIGNILDLGGATPHRFTIRIGFDEAPVAGAEQNKQVASQLKRLKGLKAKARAAIRREGFKLGADGFSQPRDGYWHHSLTIQAKQEDQQKLAAFHKRMLDALQTAKA